MSIWQFRKQKNANSSALAEELAFLRKITAHKFLEEEQINDIHNQQPR